MPIMLREFHSPKGKLIAEKVMELAQHFDSDLEQAEGGESQKQPRKSKSTLKNNQKGAKEANFKPIGDFGSFIGNQTGK